MNNILEKLHRLWFEYTRDNFLTKSFKSTAQRSENQAGTQRITYTVPTGKRAAITHISVQVIGQVTATTTTATDKVGTAISETPEGQTETTYLRAEMASDFYAAGDRVGQISHGYGYLDEGDALAMYDVFDGDSAGAGRADIHMGLLISEFDAR